MKLVFDETKVTWGDLAEIEAGRTTKQRIEFMARFVTDDNEQPVSEAEALAFVKSLNLPSIRHANAEFTKWITSLKTDAVNPPTAAS